MGKISYPNSKTLKEIFLSHLEDYPQFHIEDKGEYVPKIVIDGAPYYLFLRVITKEGGKHPEEHQRAQLPAKEEFDKVIESDTPFLFLGYDVNNRVYVCWEPDKIKKRLNKKGYVSFYTRLSIQKSVVEGEIREALLSNGDKFVLFKETDIIPFFQMIDQHFPELKKVQSNLQSEPTGTYPPTKKVESDIIGLLTSLEDDPSVKLLVDDLKGSQNILDIVSKCMNEFASSYDKMTLSNWYDLINPYLEKEEEKEEEEYDEEE